MVAFIRGRRQARLEQSDRLLMRAPMRIHLRRDIMANTLLTREQRRDAIRGLRDDDVMEAAAAQAYDLLSLEQQEELLDAAPPDEGTTGHPLLDWLWAHRQELLSFFLSLIAMFGA